MFSTRARHQRRDISLVRVAPSDRILCSPRSLLGDLSSLLGRGSLASGRGARVRGSVDTVRGNVDVPTSHCVPLVFPRDAIFSCLDGALAIVYSDLGVDRQLGDVRSRGSVSVRKLVRSNVLGGGATGL